MRPQLVVATVAAISSATPAVAELVRKPSPYPVAETVERLEATVKQRGLTVFARIDHAAAAKSIGQELRPTVLVIFGGPAAGTPLMQAEQTLGLSLPLKALVWQDASGAVWLGHDAVAAMAAERGLKDHPAIARVAGALEAIAGAALAK